MIEEHDGEFQSVTIFCFLTGWWCHEHFTSYTLKQHKLQNTGRGSWAILKEVRLTGHTDPGDSGGLKRGDITSKDFSSRKSHPKGAILLQVSGTSLKNLRFSPFYNSLMVLFTISHIFLFKFPFFSLISLFHETYLLIYSYMHLCFILASPLRLLLALPAPKHSWHYRFHLVLKIRAGKGHLSKPASLSRVVFGFIFCWADGGGLGLLGTKVISPTPHSFIGQLKLWAELFNGNQ